MLNTRLDKVRAELKSRQIECIVLLPGYNLRYLTGLNFHLSERPLILYIPAEGQPALVIPALEVSRWNENPPFEAQLFSWEDTSGPSEAVREATTALPEMQTIAVEQLAMRMLEYNLLRRHLPNIIVTEAETILDPLRLIKDPAEIASLQRAIEITEAALEEVVTAAKVGDTERQIANRLLMAMLSGGGEGVGFNPLVLSGPRAALPHGSPGDRAVQPGEVLLIDLSTTLDGYHSDITRTFIVAQEPDDQLRAMYEAVRGANAAGREAAQPGATCQDIDRAARRVIEEASLGKHFIHRTGHGLGLDIHEPPSLMEGNEMPLQAGMVFTVEPGVYIEGRAGIRIEDNIIITKDGAQSLTTFDRELRIIGD